MLALFKNSKYCVDVWRSGPVILLRASPGM